MRAIEFKSKIKNNQISIPVNLQSELKSKQNKHVRVIVLIEEFDEVYFKQTARNQFLEGYADSDSIYDHNE